jgi:hypothetical protein
MRDHCFEVDPHTGAFSHVKLPTSRSSRADYSGVGQLVGSANLPVDLVPHDLTSLEQQRADFIALWSGEPD